MSPAATEAFIGLMSGTSLDGVDAVLAEVSMAGLVVRAHAHRVFSAELRAELLALNQAGSDELHRSARAGQALARLYADAVLDLGPLPSVRAVGAHGQTVRHRPELGYTCQLLDAALLAELTGLDVVADLRSRDVAAGGQGAPLVPAFHRAVFGQPGVDVAVLNLGGMGNLSLLHADGRTTGFDTGPANALLDAWVARHRGQPFDANGAWAAQGQVLPELLAAMQAEPYFALPPPRSTGRDLFDAPWLLRQPLAGAAPEDVQATLAELTAWSVTEALRSHQPQVREVIVCGGGAFNGDLLGRLAKRLPGVGFVSSADRGLPPMQVEAAAFAWLAHRFVHHLPGNLPAVTGARGPRVLGALYPA
ncbi:MAG: anhydro-N-acetylmuramic acid kinase [Inhella sp.]|uniref:anhydro-N-acetylmuramic acid kinase n=1 Tax=Inhella sp. TaxID=1921806 RepID=UPI0022C3D30D|nr:anhydro-N-acetylmuramic acid kinase [Inhella sp.]MCZ8234026.1 anhydro-N-acetylmuramic acid kinase [Inhella sp.]